MAEKFAYFNNSSYICDVSITKSAASELLQSARKFYLQGVYLNSERILDEALCLRTKSLELRYIG